MSGGGSTVRLGWTSIVLCGGASRFAQVILEFIGVYSGNRR